MAAKLAVQGGQPVRDKPWPSWPVVGSDEQEAVAAVVASGNWAHLFSPDTSRIEELRELCARIFGVDYVILATNGSVALEMALRNAGIGHGDEVITPPTTWVATNLAPVIVGADPVFVDISPENYGLDPARVEEAVTPRTKAIIPVHIGGYPCDMNGILAVARKRGLVVIEDCAQAHGSTYKGSLVGTLGDFGCFSFEQTKLVSCGEGGMVLVKDGSLGEQVFGFSGESGNQFERVFSGGRRNVGWNSRITEMQAAILIQQFGRMEEQKQKRLRNADYLRKGLSQIPGVDPLPHAPDQNFYSYIMRYDSRRFSDVPKRIFMEALVAEGIPLFSSPSHQPPAYRSPKFYSPRRDYQGVSCPVADRVFEEEAVGFRAVGMLLAEQEDMDDIVDAVTKLAENSDALAATS